MAIDMSSNAAQVYADMGRTSADLTRRLAHTIAEATIDTRDRWRELAAETSGAHGKHYPRAITAEIGILEGAVYPDESKRQGGMSFERGSVNQPGHFSGQLTLDEMAPKIQRRIESQLVF